MNIFFLHEDPVLAARQLCDKHVVKMPTEGLQIICHNLHELNYQKNIPWKRMSRGMAKHPSTIWARESKDNFIWTWKNTWTICEEYTDRYKKQHKVERLMTELSKDVFDWLEEADFPKQGLTPFVRAIKKNIYPHLLDEELFPCTIEAYKEYYRIDKWKFATWRNDGRPDWMPTTHQLFTEKIYVNK
tara:strand:+ start:517 stop:1077 length:561 start_codon:yes stop_codon:yes gene_type:complete